MSVVDLGDHLIGRGQGGAVALSVGVGDSNLISTGALRSNGIGGAGGTTNGGTVQEPLIGIGRISGSAIRITTHGSCTQRHSFCVGTTAGDRRKGALSVVDLGDELVGGAGSDTGAGAIGVGGFHAIGAFSPRTHDIGVRTAGLNSGGTHIPGVNRR